MKHHLNRETLLLFVLGLLATVPYWTLYQDMDDEAAVAALGAVRLLKGELPYRDWMTRHTPGTYFVTAAYYFVFGSGQWGTRSLMGLVSSLSGLLIHSCSKQVTSSKLRYLPWVLWTCGSVAEKPELNHHWFGACSTLFTFYWVLRWSLNPGPRTPIWVGFSAALSSWFLQSNGLSSLLMVILVWLRFRPAGLGKTILAYLLTDLVLWLPWLGYAHEVWLNHLRILTRHITFNRQAYSWQRLSDLSAFYRHLDIRFQTIHFLAAWSQFGRVCLQYGLYYIAIPLAWVIAEKRRKRAQIALAYGCVAWALTTGYCQTIDYLSYAAPAFQLAMLCLLDGQQRLAAGWGLLEIAGWFFRACSVSVAFCYPIATRAGTYWAADPQNAYSLNQLHAWIENHCPENSPVLAYPYFSRVYTLEKLNNPIQQAVLLPWLYEDKEFIDCAAVMDREKTPFILHRVLNPDVILTEYRNTPAEEFRQEYALQGARIFNHYQKVWEVPGYEVWARKP
ncbi:MAG: hypothetical protein KF760_13330 [Candidatus Eremiobacteraeota bacterium]|nr:hypothetical protein [Candidatus Eremiobacteraeota bacterium]MCW5872714.1 hypothetical protein [Candidatus Eremiobacteraeota bacterium]